MTRNLLAFALACSLAQAANLPQVALIPLQSKGVPDQEVSVISDALSNELANSGAVRVLERGQMDQILKEQGFQQSGACDGGSCAVEMGRLLGVQRLVVGSVGRVGSTYVLNARTVDVASGEVIKSASRKRAGALDAVLTDDLPLLARDLVGVAEEAPGAPGKPTASSGNPSESKGSSAWLWWTAGGLAVAGGAAAAAILLTGDKASPGTDPVTRTADYNAVWSE